MGSAEYARFIMGRAAAEDFNRGRRASRAELFYFWLGAEAEWV